MSDQGIVSLTDACWAVMTDKEALARYPEGVSAPDVLDEIRRKFGANAWPLVTWLDVYNEMRDLYGEPRDEGMGDE